MLRECVDVLLWNVMPSTVVINRRFGGSYYFHFQCRGSNVCISNSLLVGLAQGSEGLCSLYLSKSPL